MNPSATSARFLDAAFASLLAIMAASGCAKSLEDLEPFPCAKDGSCPTGYRCNPKDICVSRSSCDPGMSACGGDCTDTDVDPSNCGSCGNVCKPGAECSDGSCFCPSMTTDCGDVCSVMIDDSANCGSCGNVCAPSEICIDSQCGCAPGQESCPSGCADLATDESNCGGCGSQCSDGWTCESSQCTCPNQCNEQCVSCGSVETAYCGATTGGGCCPSERPNYCDFAEWPCWPPFNNCEALDCSTIVYCDNLGGYFACCPGDGRVDCSTQTCVSDAPPMP